MRRTGPIRVKATPFENTLCALVCLTMLITPFAFMRESVDIFRTPKNVLFQTGALVIFALAVAGAMLSDRIAATLRLDKTASIVAGAAVLWAAVTTVVSLKPEVSFFKPLPAFCLAVFFGAAMWIARGRGPWLVTAALAPAVINALVAMMQTTKGLLVVVASKQYMTSRLRTTGFIGNPNELGGYLLLPLLAAVGAAVAWPKWRWLFAAASLILTAGLVAAQSVTSLVAAGAGVAAMMFLPGGRVLRWVGITAFVLLFAGVALFPGTRARMERLAQAGSLSEMTSFRLPAFAVAIDMFLSRPMIGVGPGVYAAQYMPYKIRLDEKHPEWIRMGNENFGEVHNDHLQLLAENGLPGYALFLVALVLLGRLSFRRLETLPPRQKFVRSFAFPAAAAFFVLSLGHFPLHLISTMMPAVYLAALCFTWKDADEIS